MTIIKLKKKNLKYTPLVSQMENSSGKILKIIMTYFSESVHVTYITHSHSEPKMICYYYFYWCYYYEHFYYHGACLKNCVGPSILMGIKQEI